MNHNIKIPKPTNYEKFFSKQNLGWIVNLSKKKRKLKDNESILSLICQS